MYKYINCGLPSNCMSNNGIRVMIIVDKRGNRKSQNIGLHTHGPHLQFITRTLRQKTRRNNLTQIHRE
jgi:hypothetical protein